MEAKKHDLFEYIDKAFWALLTAAAWFVADQIGKMNVSIQELNQRMAEVLTTLKTQEKTIDKHEVRLEKLETKGK